MDRCVSRHPRVCKTFCWSGMQPHVQVFVLVRSCLCPEQSLPSADRPASTASMCLWSDTSLDLDWICRVSNSLCCQKCPEQGPTPIHQEERATHSEGSWESSQTSSDRGKQQHIIPISTILEMYLIGCVLSAVLSSSMTLCLPTCSSSSVSRVVLWNDNW